MIALGWFVLGLAALIVGAELVVRGLGSPRDSAFLRW